MGCVFELLLAGRERAYLEEAGGEALDEIARLDSQLSHTRDISDVCALNAGASQGPVRVDPRLFELLERAAEISAETGGAFDVTIGALVKLWGFHRGDHSVPTSDEVTMALKSVGMGHLRFDAEWNAIGFDREGVELNLGAIGKGYAVQRAVEVLRECGIESALLHGGSSTIYALGAPPGEECWTVGLRHPDEPSGRVGVVRLRDQALSTSGGYEQFFMAGGRVFSHLLDPRTGYPAEGTLSASVIADSATESDALSTAFFVIGAKETGDYCLTHQEIRAVLISPRVGGGIEIAQFGRKESLEEREHAER